MSEELQSTSASAKTTDARFSLRAIFVAGGCVALAAAIAGPFVRSLSADQQLRILLIWSIWGAAVACWIGVHAHRRVKFEKAIGQTLVSVPAVGPGGFYKSRIGAALHAIASFASGLLYLSFVTRSALNPSPAIGLLELLTSYGLMGILSVWIASLSVTVLWSGTRLGELGVLSENQVLFWPHVLSCRWLESNENLLELTGIARGNANIRFKIRVPAQQRESIQTILSTKVPQGRRDQTSSAVSALGQLPVSSVLGTRKYRVHLVLALSGVLLALAIYYFSLEHPTGVPEFDSAVFIGIIISFASAGYRSRWAGRDAGAPIVRVLARRDLFGFVSVVITAGAIRVIGSRFGWSSVGLAYVAGAAFGFFVGSTFLYFALTQLDLRENGIVMQGESYWPWRVVRVLRWQPHDGRLIMGRGWRRIMAHVPPEHCEAVESVLREKLKIGG